MRYRLIAIILIDTISDVDAAVQHERGPRKPRLKDSLMAERQQQQQQMYNNNNNNVGASSNGVLQQQQPNSIQQHHLENRRVLHSINNISKESLTWII